MGMLGGSALTICLARRSSSNLTTSSRITDTHCRREFACCGTREIPYHSTGYHHRLGGHDSPSAMECHQTDAPEQAPRSRADERRALHDPGKPLLHCEFSTGRAADPP